MRIHVTRFCSVNVNARYRKFHRTQQKMIAKSIRQEIDEKEGVEQVEEPEATSILMLFRYNFSCVDNYVTVNDILF